MDQFASNEEMDNNAPYASVTCWVLKRPTEFH